MDIHSQLKLEKIEKPIDEMTVPEMKAALKICNRNIKKLEKAIVKYNTTLQAEELKNKVNVKASNKNDGNLAPVDSVSTKMTTKKSTNPVVSKKSTTPIATKSTVKPNTKK